MPTMPPFIGYRSDSMPTGVVGHKYTTNPKFRGRQGARKEGDITSNMLGKRQQTNVEFGHDSGCGSYLAFCTHGIAIHQYTIDLRGAERVLGGKTVS